VFADRGAAAAVGAPGAADEAGDRRLTAALNEAAGWQQVETLLRGHPRAPNEYHVAAALSRLAALRGRPAPAAPRGRRAAPEPLDDGEATFVMALARRLAAAWRGLPPVTLVACLVGLARLEAELEPDAEAGALAAVGAAAGALLRHQAVSCLWALAKLGAAPPPGWVRGVVGAAALGRPEGLQQLQPRSLVALMWALARLRAPLSGDEARALLLTAAADAPALGPQGLAMTAWAAARLGLARAAGPAAAHAWADEWAGALERCALGAGAHDVALALWAAATLDMPRGGGASGGDGGRSNGSCGEQGGGGSAHARGGDGDSSSAQGATRWRPPPALLEALAMRVAAEAAASDPRAATGSDAVRGAGASELAVSLWALGRLGFRPPAITLRALADALLAAADAGALAPRGYTMAVCALAALRAPPGPRWLDALLRCAFQVLPLFTPREAAGLLAGLAALRHIPGAAWMDVWWWDTAGKLPDFGPQELANSLRAAVELGQAPPLPWLRAWHSRSLRLLRAGALGGQALGMALPAFAALERAPGPVWMDAFWQVTCGGVISEAGIGVARASSSSSSSRSSVPSSGNRGGNGSGIVIVSCGGSDDDRLTPLAAWDLFTCERVVRALGRLRLAPPAPWAAAMLAHTRPLLAAADARQLAGLVWGLAVLGVKPGDAWMEACATGLRASGALEELHAARLPAQQQQPAEGSNTTSSSSGSSSSAVTSGGGRSGGGGGRRLRRVRVAELLWGLELLDPGESWVRRRGVLPSWRDV
jgi:uncharacterized membrane protein YgcG